MEFLHKYQLDVMLFLAGICAVLAGLTLMTRTLSSKRRRILFMMEIAAALMLVAERLAYIYRGDPSETGFWMVRICNFLNFLLILDLGHGFSLYLRDLYKNEGGLQKSPIQLRICDFLYVVGAVLLVVSQFTGLYYTFDAQNTYHRAPGFIISYIIPVLVFLLQLSVIIRYRGRLSRAIQFSLLIYAFTPFLASLIQLFTYGVSLMNIMLGVVVPLLYVYALNDMNSALKRARQREIELLREEQQREHAMFEQTAEALVNAIDAKDSYTNGHSKRVAEYSRSIAQAAGMSAQACEDIYFAALLHDVGKISVPLRILTKKGRLTDAEFAQIKQHPVVGGQILSSIQQSPHLRVAALYHHERYDGRGYPEGLKGEAIPEIARVIAVADAYDAMTSNRSYRAAIAQHLVREELVKGTGTQFDPEFARTMIHLLDRDTEYHMRELESREGRAMPSDFHCEGIYDGCSKGVFVSNRCVRIRLRCRPDAGFDPAESLPTLLLFDALDGMAHPGEEDNPYVHYHEYARIRLDGRVEAVGIRKAAETDVKAPSDASDGDGWYDIEALRVKDHALVRITGEGRSRQIVLALPDCSRYCYIAVTGEHCRVSGLRVQYDEARAADDAIPRIAEEISFIRDSTQGDIPNIQVDNWRSASTQGIPIEGGLKLCFRSQSLPTSRLVWQCAYISVFTSADGQPGGKRYREYALMRLDGEDWESNEHAENRVQTRLMPDFVGWDEWKKQNRQGIDCEVEIRREGRQVTLRTENLGIEITCVTTIRDDVRDVYVALTGDQCTVTNIRLSREA